MALDAKQRFYLGAISFTVGILLIIFAGGPLNSAAIGFGLSQNIHLVLGIVLAIAALMLFRPIQGRK